MANEKEILRGTIVLDLASFYQKLDTLPSEIEKRTNKLNQSFTKLANDTDKNVDKIIVPLKKLQTELDNTGKKLTELGVISASVWKLMSETQQNSNTEMRRSSKETNAAIERDLRGIERVKNEVRANDQKAQNQAIQNQVRLSEQSAAQRRREETQAAQHAKKLADIQNASARQQTPTTSVPVGNRSQIGDPTLGRNMKELTASVNQANNAIAEAEKRIYALYRAGAQISQLSFIFSMFAGSVLAGMGMIVKGAEGFDTWTRKAYAAGQATGEFSVTIDELQQQILGLSSEIGSFSPTEVAEAFYYWQSAVGDTVSSSAELASVLQNQLLPVMQAVSLSEVPIGQAVKGVTSAAAEFGLQVEDTTRVVQVMLATTQLTNSEFADMIQSFTYLGAGAAQLGISVEEAAAVMGRLADVNVRGGNAGRALQQVIQGILDPSNKAAAALNNIFSETMKVGESWENILFPMGEFVGLLDEYDKVTDEIVSKGMLSLMADELRQMDEHTRQQAIAQISTNNAFRALMPLLEDYVFNMEGATTRTQELYAILQDNPAALFSDQLAMYQQGIKEQFGRRLNEIKAMLIEFGLAAQYALIPFLDAFSTAARAVREFARANPELTQFAIQITALAASVALVGAALGMVVGNLLQLSAVMRLIPALSKLGSTLFASFASIPGAVVLVIGAITALWVAWSNNWGNIVDSIKEGREVFIDLGRHIMAIARLLTDAFDALMEGDFETLAEKMDMVIQRILAALLQLAAAFGPAIMSMMSAFFSDVDQALTDWLGTLYTTGRDAGGRLVAGIRDQLQNELQNIVNVANNVLGGLGSLDPTRKLTGRATGGQTGYGELTLVGERGAELLRLPAGTMVYPAHMTDSILNAMPFAEGGVVPGVPEVPSGAGRVAGAKFGAEFMEGVQRVVDFTRILNPTDVIEKANDYGRTFADRFIQGFTSADMGQFSAFMDDIIGHLNNLMESNLLGAGEAGIAAFISGIEIASEAVAELIRVVQSGGDVTDDLYARLGSVAGPLVDDILAVAYAWGNVQQAMAAVSAQQVVISGLQDQKNALDDIKDGIQDVIDSLEDQKEPYEDQLEAIDDIIAGINRQKRELDRLKEPYEDQLEAIDDIVRGLERSLDPIRDAQYALQQQKQALEDIIQGYNDQIEGLNRAKDAIEDQKVGYQDQIDAINDIIEGLERQKRALDDMKQPLEDQKLALQDQLIPINDMIEGLQEQLALMQEAQENELAPLREALDARRMELDLAREAEEIRREGVQDEFQRRQDIIDAMREQFNVEMEGAEAALAAREEELDAIRTRMALEEEIARRRTEEASLMGASENVTQFLKFQEAMLKRRNQGALDPAEARLKQEQDLLERRKAIEEARIGREEKLLERDQETENRKQARIDREFRNTERSITADQRAIEAREREFEQQNKIIEQQIAAAQKQAEAIEKEIRGIERRIEAIDREERLLERQIELENRRKEPLEQEIKNLDRRQEMIDREIRRIEQERQAYEDQIDAINRQEEQLNREAELINRQIELENRRKDALEDEIRAIERREKLLDREIADLEDSKLPIQEQIDAIDDQIEAQEKLAEGIDDQIKLIDRKIEQEQETLKKLQSQQKVYEDQLATAKAIYDWHQKINDILDEQNKKLGKLPAKDGGPDGPTGVNNFPNTINDIPPPDTTPLEKSLLLSAILWEQYLERIRNITIPGLADILTDQQEMMVEHAARALGLTLGVWADWGPRLAVVAGEIGDNVAVALRRGVTAEGGLAMMTNFAEGAGRAVGLFTEAGVKGGTALATGVKDGWTAFLATADLGSLGGLDDLMKGFSDINTPGTVQAPFQALLPGMDDFIKNLDEIARIQDGLTGFGAVADDLDDVVRAVSGGSGDIKGLAFFAQYLDDTAKAGSRLAGVFTGAKSVLGAGGPLGWLITIALDTIIVFVKNWDTISNRLGESFTFISTVIGEKLQPIFNDFIKTTKEKGEPALRNVMIVLGFIDEVIQTVITSMGAFLDQMGPVLGPALEIVIGLLGIFLEVLKSVWFIFLDLLGLNFDGIGETLSNLFTRIQELSAGLWESLKELVANLIPTILEGMKEGGKVLLEAAGELFGKIWPEGKKKLDELWEGLKNWWDSLPTGLKTYLDNVLHAMMNPFEGLWDFLFGHSLFPDLWEALKKWWGELPKNILTALGDFVGFVSEPFIALWKWLDNWLGISAETGIRKGMNDGWTAVKNTIAGVIGLASAAAGGADITVDDSTILGTILGPFVAVFNWVNDSLFGDTGLIGAFKDGWALVKDAVAKAIGIVSGSSSLGGISSFDDDTVLGKILNPFIAVYNWVIDTFFGKEGSGGGITNAFKTGFEAVKTFVAGVIGAFNGTGMELLPEGTIMATILNPFIGIYKWVGTTLFGTEEGEGLVGKFFKGFGAIKKVVQEVLGTDENTGIWSIIKKLYENAFKPFIDAFTFLVDKLQNFPGIPEPLQKLLELASSLFGGGGAGGYAPPDSGGSGGSGGAGGYAPPVSNLTGPIELHHGTHSGAVDLFANEGEEIRAVGPGTVSQANYNSLGGNIVWVNGDDGRDYYYAHMRSQAEVSEGQHVSAGTRLGEVGRTGNAVNTPPHLHLGIGYGIGEGDGPDGGAGLNFDAVGFLQALYGGGDTSGFGGFGMMDRARDALKSYIKSLFGLEDYDPNQLPPDPTGGMKPGVYDPAAWGNPSPDQLEALMRGSGLSGLGGYINAVAEALGIPESVAMTIFKLESQYNSVGSLVKHNNPSGLTGSRWPGQTGNTPSPPYARTFAIFDSIENGILASVQNMASPLYRNKTVRQFLATWLTGSASGLSDEQGNTVENYVRVFRDISSALGLNVSPDGPVVAGYKEGLFTVPRDMFAKVHANEMIVPADFAKQLRASLTTPTIDTSRSIATGRGGDTKVEEIHYHLTIDGQSKALDPEDNRRMMQRLAHVTGGQRHGF